MNKKSLAHFLVKHYRVLFRSSLIEGFVFLSLFLTGLARYRFAIVFMTRGILSAVNQYYMDRGSNAKITEYWPIINSGLIGLVLISVFMDISKGQIYPKYTDLPIWVTVISVGLGYGFTLLLHVKIGSLFQKISGNAVFTVCPSCGYASIKVVEKCGNCGYEKGMPLAEHKEEKKEIHEELKQKIEKYNHTGLHGKLFVKGLKLQHDERIMIAAKAPSIKLGTILKNGERSILNKYNEFCVLNRIVVTNKRICFISEINGGWKEIICCKLGEVVSASTENKWLYSPLLDEVSKMTIKTITDTYLLSGTNPRKLFDAIFTIIKKQNLTVEEKLLC